MLFEHARNINTDRILFEDAFESRLDVPGAIFKQWQNTEGGTEYVLEYHGHIVATGGFIRNYNFPYIDMYYDVKEDYRRKGFGSLITQELKKEAYRLNRVPAARCNADNLASKATLLKAGMRICGYILIGELFPV